MSADERDEKWRRYVDAASERGPHPHVVEALTHATVGCALDLGCGAGGDALGMLEHGHEVVAFDRLPEAIRLTRERATARGLDHRLHAEVRAFEEMELEPDSLDLVCASFSLPFCSLEYFPLLWNGLRRALRPGGVLSAQLFGDRDEWATEAGHESKVFLSATEVDEHLAGLERLAFREEEGPGKTLLGREKHWHVFHFTVRRPAS